MEEQEGEGAEAGTRPPHPSEAGAQALWRHEKPTLQPTALLKGFQKQSGLLSSCWISTLLLRSSSVLILLTTQGRHEAP